MKDNWISCEDRLPPKDGSRVVIFAISSYIARWGTWTNDHCNDWGETECWCVYDSEDSFYSFLINDVDVTHWMPLPEKPKECA